MQQRTHYAAGRPYGLGLLVVGHDVTGPCLFETCPSGQFWQCKAMALGARSQAAKTYLERKLDEFPGASVDDLVLHALLALQVCTPFLGITWQLQFASRSLRTCPMAMFCA